MFRIFLFSNKTFDGILSDEKVILLARKHRFFFYLPIFLFIFLVSLPLFLLNFLVDFTIYQKFHNLVWFLITIYISILWLTLFFNLMIYSLTTLIVTNKRIIKIEERGLFNYDRAEIELNKIQDIQVNISGLLGNFLNFGQISIQSAGTEIKFNFDLLPSPLKIKDEILKAKNSIKIKN